MGIAPAYRRCRWCMSFSLFSFFPPWIASRSLLPSSLECNLFWAFDFLPTFFFSRKVCFMSVEMETLFFMLHNPGRFAVIAIWQNLLPFPRFLHAFRFPHEVLPYEPLSPPLSSSFALDFSFLSIFFGSHFFSSSPPEVR